MVSLFRLDIFKIMGCDLRRCNIFTVLVCLTDLCIHFSGSFSHDVKFKNFMFIQKISTQVVCVNIAPLVSERALCEGCSPETKWMRNILSYWKEEFLAEINYFWKISANTPYGGMLPTHLRPPFNGDSGKLLTWMPKSCYLNFKSCHRNFLIFLVIKTLIKSLMFCSSQQLLTSVKKNSWKLSYFKKIIKKGQTFKKFEWIVVFYKNVDFFELDFAVNLYFAQKLLRKAEIFSTLLEPQKGKGKA